jgi:hypothetical protein
MRWSLLPILMLCLPADRSVVAKPPIPPRTIFAVRVGPGVIGVQWMLPKLATANGFRVFKAASADGPYEAVADRRLDQAFFLDADVKPGLVYFYKAASLGEAGTRSKMTDAACARDDDQLLVNGSFEITPQGVIDGQPAGWPSRAYNWKTPAAIVAGGPDGKQCVEIRASDASVSGGFYSGMIPAVEGETFAQFAWARSLPGARPLVGRCFYGEDRELLKTIPTPYSYTSVGQPLPDGWTPHEGNFTVPKSGGYFVVWLIGAGARNTLWFDGARITDLTSRRVRSFPADQNREETSRLLAASAVARKHRAEFEKVGAEVAACRKRMREELATLTPLEYRRLLVTLDVAQQQWTEWIWRTKSLALLLDDK